MESGLRHTIKNKLHMAWQGAARPGWAWRGSAGHGRVLLVHLQRAIALNKALRTRREHD